MFLRGAGRSPLSTTTAVKEGPLLRRTQQDSNKEHSHNEGSLVTADDGDHNHHTEIINTNGDTIVMLNDGNITFTHSAQVTINCEDAIINCNNTVINHSSSIELGEGASEKVVLGNKFMSLFKK